MKSRILPLALAIAGAAANAQLPLSMPGMPNVPSIPGLLDLLESGRGAEIPRGRTGAMALHATVRGFSDAGCQLSGPAAPGSLAEVQRLTQALIGEMGGEGAMTAGMFYKMSPNYADTLMFVSRSPCESRRTQTTLGNLIAHLRARYDPNAPAPAPATAPPGRPERPRPRPGPDDAAIAARGCEQARARLEALRARDRGDARSATLIERQQASVNRLCGTD